MCDFSNILSYYHPSTHTHVRTHIHAHTHTHVHAHRYTHTQSSHAQLNGDEYSALHHQPARCYAGRQHTTPPRDLEQNRTALEAIEQAR